MSHIMIKKHYNTHTHTHHTIHTSLYTHFYIQMTVTDSNGNIHLVEAYFYNDSSILFVLWYNIGGEVLHLLFDRLDYGRSK